MQIASQLLTLQGAVAHSDMPVEGGSTRLLPFSQQFHKGYMAYRQPEFTQYFLENYVSLPLELGDGLFFNPALFHAAGENRTTDMVRSANLLQVSSAFGKPMESLDTISLVERCWDALRQKFDAEGSSVGVDAIVAAVAEGYPFPTNLDRRPPAPGGIAPESEQDIVRIGLKERWDVKRVTDAVRKIKNDSES
jgi:ectoine hydroxylase-related dioxygenase (phytanoyl-CoA dioxygenase family)